MTRNLLYFLGLLVINGITCFGSYGQTVSHDVITCTDFRVTPPLRELVLLNPVNKEKDFGGMESPDRSHRVPQTFLYTPADGAIYGEDPSVRQTVMGTRDANTGKALIKNWLGQVVTGFRPMDPSGSVSSAYYVQMINSTTFEVFNKNTGAVVLTANLSSLWSPATPDDGDPIVMYDKYADRWFLSQFGQTGNRIYIAISTTNDPAGSYYTYTFTSPQFPDYLKFSIWENGYYMTSNQSTDKVFCFERDQMVAGNPSARAISANFTTGSTSAFFVPLPADAADGGLPAAGTPLPFFAYYDNAWGGGNDGINIWNMTVNWGTTPSASISASTLITTAVFDGSYDPSWNDITQPGTTQKLDGIGGVPTYRAQWRPWSGYNSLVMNWGVKISASQRSIRWVELRQNQTTGVWSLYQEGTYTPDAHSRWMGSIAMDNNGSIALAYAKSSSTIFPGLCYTGRLASDPLGTMSFAETVAIAGTSVQTGTNRFGDYSHTSLDPDGVTFWHTGEYIASGVKTRIFSFQLPSPTLPPVADFTATPTNALCSGTVLFTDNSTGSPTTWLWDFGDGTTSNSQNPTHTYSANGTYTVTLTATNANGNNQKIRNNYITVNIPVTPAASGNSRCGTGTVSLSAIGSGVMHWYDSFSGGTDLGTGTAFTTPSISSTTTFYVENHVVQASQYAGPLSNFAAGSYSNTAYTLTFNCLSSCTLVSVAVDKQTAGNVVIQLTDAVGTVLQSGTFTVPSGASRVSLNWPLPVATGLKLAGPANSGLWRVNTGGTFPYTLSGLVSITGCSSTTRYGSFFDWEIKQPDCVSARVSAVAIVNTSVTPSVSIAASASSICTGTTVTFTASPVNGGTPVYQWKLNGANVGANNAVYTNSALANGDIVICNMTSSLSCTSTPTVTSNAVTMTVSSAAAPSVVISADAATICPGTPVTFTASPTNGGTPAYQWKLNGANTGTNNAVYTSGTLADGDVVSCVMTTSLSCASSPTATSNNITITVSPSVTPSVSITASNTTICSGSSVTFTATPVNGGVPAYQWKINGANAGTNNSVFIPGALSNGDVVSCDMTTSLSCPSTPTATSNSVTMTVNTTVTPSVTIVASETAICYGATVTFSATPANGGTPSYQWFINGSGTGTNNAVYSGNTFANGDIITCEMTSSLNCVTGTTATSNPVTISVNTLASPVATGNSRCGTGTVDLTAGGTGVLHWYDASSGGTDLGTGTSFTTPSISASTTFYAEDQSVVASQYVGPLSNFAAGQYSNTSYTLTFDCFAPCTLVSVAVDKQTAGNIFIQLTNSGGTVLQSGTFSITAGAGRVILNWPLGVATGLKLVGPASSGLWRVNTAGAFPYTAAGLVSITGCSSGARYGSFFDWEVREPACASPRTPVVASVETALTTSVSVSAGSSVICSGTPVIFTAVPSNGGTPSYQWKLNGINVGTNSDTYTNNSLADGDVVTCDMTSSLACTSNPVATSNAVTMSVSSSVTPSVSIAASEPVICTGTPVTFTATPSNGGVPVYQWKLNGSNTGTNDPVYTNSTLSDGDVVACEMTSSLTCATTSFASSNTITLTVNSAVTPSVTITSDTTSICSGTSVIFTALPVNGGTPSYQWQLNGLNVGPDSGTYTNGALMDGDIISCQITSSVACVTNPTVISNTITITVYPTVTPAVVIATGVTSVCNGTSVTFTATASNGGVPSYQWQLNGANAGIDSDTYSDSTFVDGDIITCIMTSSLSCTSNPSVTSNAITLNVNTSVTPSVSITASATTICSGSPVTFTASPVNGGTPVFQWMLNSSGTGSGGTTYTSGTLSDGDIVTCSMTSSLACATTPDAGSNAVTIAVNPSVTPGVSISAGATSVCSGSPVTFTAIPSNGGTPAYQWLLNGANTGTNSDVYTNGTLSDGDVVSCEMTSSLSCAPNPTVTSNSVTITVIPSVSPSVAITASETNICAGAQVTFTASQVNGGAPVYQWYLNGAMTGINSDTYTNGTLSDGDIVTCDMTGSLSCATSSTVTSNAVTMTVNVTVTPAVSVSASATSICPGTSVTFSASAVNGGTPSYQWKLNGTNTGTNSSIYINGTLGNGDIVSCEMTSSITCASIQTVVSNTIAVTVNSSPVVDAGADQTVCEGEPVTLSGNGAMSYFWNNGIEDGVAFFPSSGVFIYTVTGISNGCSGSDQVMITVNTVPNVIAGSDQNICEGSPVTLSGSGATSYIWDNGVINDSVFFPAIGTNTYTLTGIANGCVNTDQVIVTVNAVPNVNGGPDKTVCEGSYITLSGSGAATYFWNNGVIDGAAFAPLLGVNIYNVTGILNGCSNTDQVVVTVNALPVVDAGTDQTVCFGASVTLAGSGAASYSWNNGIMNGVAFTPAAGSITYTLTGTTNDCSSSDQVLVTVNSVDNYTLTTNGPVIAVTDLPGATYQWIDCNNGNQGIPGETNTSFTPLANGNYGVVINQNGCTSTSTCVFMNVTEILQNSGTYGINIYPNPTKGMLNIRFDSELKNVSIVLENVIGQKVFETKTDQVNGSERKIDLGKFATGLYFINITNEDINLKYKIIYKD